MKKKLYLIGTSVFFMLVSSPVYAKPSGGVTDCSVFSDILKPFYRYIIILSPIIALVMSGVDIFKAVASSDEKSMKQAFSSLIKRLLILVGILLLPIIVNYIMNIINGYDLKDCGLM